MTEENENMIDLRMERSDLDMTFAEIEFGQRASLDGAGYMVVLTKETGLNGEELIQEMQRWSYHRRHL